MATDRLGRGGPGVNRLMDARLVALTQALRAAGGRVSLAESEDAARALAALSSPEREGFRLALRACLSKSSREQALFDEYFPFFFGTDEPSLRPIPDGLSAEEQEQLQEALAQLEAMSMGERAGPWRPQGLLEQLLEGRAFSDERLRQLSGRVGLASADNRRARAWFQRRLERKVGFSRLSGWLESLREALEAQGMSPASAEELLVRLRENAEHLREQLAQFLGRRLAEGPADGLPKEAAELLDLPFWRLREEEEAQIRAAIRRLVARIRSRVALRQKRARRGEPDPRLTLRANLPTGGVPFRIERRRRQLRPSLVLLCDLSTSVRHCAEFLLTMIYELQDQVQRTRSYVYIHDLHDISEMLKAAPPEQALPQILTENRPGHYSTDLGYSLRRFQQEHMGRLDGRTTVLFLGDGRNNYNDPNLEAIREMRRAARRLFWFVPESRRQWGSGDSDMLLYAEHADAVFPVQTLRQLARAVDEILVEKY